MSKTVQSNILSLALIILLLASCVHFQPKPVTVEQAQADFETRRLDDPGLKKYLLESLTVKDWPPQAWDLKALTLAAFYYHPDLDVARAQWGVAEAGVITAGARPNPTLGLLMGYNSTTPVSEITPWIPEVVLDIPIETAGKRGIRIKQARRLSEAARWNILSVAWEVRSRLRQALLDFYEAGQIEALLTAQLAVQEESARLLELQLNVGEASVYDVTQARIALDNSRLAHLEAASLTAEARAHLAGALGLPGKALDGITVSFDNFERINFDIPGPELRRRTVLTRADILGALAEYEASQSALQLEVRKQYPDIHLGPGYQLDQTDNKWTLGISLELPILNRNRGPIAEAEARRRESAARFLALQANVISELEAAVAACQTALQKSQTAEDLLTGLEKQERSARAKYQLGEISKLELYGVLLELSAGRLSRLDALVKAQRSIGRLEDAMQSPLAVSDWIQKTPPRESGKTKERDHE
jgi:outer membrane protein TolC